MGRIEHSHPDEFSQGASPTTRLPKAAANTHQGNGGGGRGRVRFPRATTAIPVGSPGLPGSRCAPGKVAVGELQVVPRQLVIRKAEDVKSPPLPTAGWLHGSTVSVGEGVTSAFRSARAGRRVSPGGSPMGELLSKAHRTRGSRPAPPLGGLLPAPECRLDSLQ